MAPKYIRNWSSKQIPLGICHSTQTHTYTNEANNSVRGCMWCDVKWGDGKQEGESVKKRLKYFGSRSSKCVVCKAFKCCVLFVPFGWLARVCRLKRISIFTPNSSHEWTHFPFRSIRFFCFPATVENFLLCMENGKVCLRFMWDKIFASSTYSKCESIN